MLMRKVTSAYRPFDAAPCYLLSHVCTYNRGEQGRKIDRDVNEGKRGMKEEMLAEKKEGDERREGMIKRQRGRETFPWVGAIGN